MTRRERLERKAELRREWAAKRKAQAAASFQRAHDLVDPIPLGQPILVGHHSEKAHRRVLAKADGAMAAGCESQSMAEHHAAKAAGIEQQLERSVFSDDPDAIEALEAKIAKAEAFRDLMKAANTIIRGKPKNEPTDAKIANLVALGLSETHARKLFEPDFAGRIGFASYELTNLGANIRRMRERIEEIRTRQQRQEAADDSSGGVLIEGGDWVRITFAEKPDRDVLDALKAAGFRWGGGSWSGRRIAIPAVVHRLADGEPCECERPGFYYCGVPGVLAHMSCGRVPADAAVERCDKCKRYASDQEASEALYALGLFGTLRWWSLDRPFKVLVRCGLVYCWQPGNGFAHRTDVDGGRWMNHHDPCSAPWERIDLTPDQLANFEATARDCYCYQGVDRCDFCNGVRTPDGQHAFNSEIF